MALLEVRNLRVHFQAERGVVRAVEGISFHIDEGEIVAIVGESGCGKSVTSMSILGLIGQEGRQDGEIRFEGRDLLKLSESELRDIRGDRIGMIFQDPSTSLNPVLKVGHQITEALRLHRDMSSTAARARAIELLKLVGIPAP